MPTAFFIYYFLGKNADLGKNIVFYEEKQPYCWKKLLQSEVSFAD
jgi:hypothetical protein